MSGGAVLRMRCYIRDRRGAVLWLGCDIRIRCGASLTWLGVVLITTGASR